jgi:hypothetical protein
MEQKNRRMVGAEEECRRRMDLSRRSWMKKVG